MATQPQEKYAMSRLQKRSVIAFVVLFILALSFIDHNLGKKIRPKVEAQTSSNSDVRKYHLKTFTVVNVVDGDTLDIDIPDGEYENTRIRLIGVDTPETKNPRVEQMYYGPQASDYVRQIALDKKVRVIIDSISSARDKYNRLLAYIQFEDGNMLNEMIIKNGFGYADLRFAHSRFEKYTATQSQAVKNKIGLWKNVQKNQLPNWLNRENPDILEKKQP
jgi:endonuclease YncB( thermonuclease family)